MSVTESQVTVVERLATQLDAALGELGKAKPFAKSIYQTDVFQISETLLGTDAGLRALYERAHRFDEVGVFHGGPWVDPGKLQPQLVAGGLKASGVYPIVEILSELRMLAAAKGIAGGSASQSDANRFLHEVLALNLEYIFPGDSEEERMEGGPHRVSSIRLFALLAEELGLAPLLGDVVAEIDQVCSQRPVMTKRIRKMIAMANRIPAESSSPDLTAKLQRFGNAIACPSPLSREHPTLAEYRQAVIQCDSKTLEQEARAFAKSVTETGLVCPFHAVLLRCLRTKEPELIVVALALNDLGAAEFTQNKEIALQLIRVAILPSTAQCIYGFAKLLENGLLSRQEVSAGMTKLIDIDLKQEVKLNLLSHRDVRDGASANALLLAGVMSVFGQPLGVGQGSNPTCQAARAISLWAQHAHGHLLELLISAARDGIVEIPFEGAMIQSDKLTEGVAITINYDLDPVSAVLVPHLDLIYFEMMKRVAYRLGDGHKWVNPAFYGRWVSNGFATVMSPVASNVITDHDEFVRRFYATHHPAYNDGHAMMYPNPVGILVTNSHGDYLGPHAISLQRVTEDPQGNLRVYFYNPNNEGRQNWGSGVKPTVTGHGELEGESSLLFHDFAARLYAFHYNPYEEGDAYAVPANEIEAIEQAARTTWGRVFTWVNTAGP